jgi:hypothetical protein
MKPKTVGDLCNLLERRPGLTCAQIGEELWPSARGNRQAPALRAIAMVARAMRAGRVKEKTDAWARRHFFLANEPQN